MYTCRENLAYAAHLKLPRDLADAHRRGAVIDDALEMLQLKHIQHYRVG
jgi:ABC-type multidrug transport system ATPase subunit